MPKYYLVSLYDTETGAHKPSFWMKDEGRKWNFFLRGILKPKHRDDIVREIVYAENPVFLDWGKTPLLDPSSTAGWLSRSGRFYGCLKNHHEQLAYYVIGLSATELEEMGWVRIKSSRYFYCDKELTPEQRDWLLSHGHKLYDPC